MSPWLSWKVEGQTSTHSADNRGAVVQRKWSEGSKSAIERVSEWLESTECVQSLGHTAVSVWKPTEIFTTSSMCVWVICKCKVLRAAKSSALFVTTSTTMLRKFLMLQHRNQSVHLTSHLSDLKPRCEGRSYLPGTLLVAMRTGSGLRQDPTPTP
jgi:hypothetical protein